MIRKYKILLVFLLICSCFQFPSYAQEEVLKDIEKQIENDISYLPEEWENIMGLDLSNGKEKSYNSIVYMENPEDALYLFISCSKSVKAEYKLKIFLDYKELNIIIDGQEYETYDFSMDDEEIRQIAFQLPENSLDLKTSHIVTVCVIQNPESKKRPDNGYTGMKSFDFEVTSKSGKREILTEESSIEPDHYQTISYCGLELNDDFDFNNADSVLFPPEQIKVARGEQVSLAYRTGNYENVEEVLFVVMAGWEQLPVNGKPYVYVKTKEGQVSCGRLEFTAPEKSGEYTVTGFVTTSPFELRNDNNRHYNDVSTRFTLVVE